MSEQDGVHRREHAAGRDQLRHRRARPRARVLAAGRRARPGRPTTTWTRGSSGSRRTWSRACGWASTSRGRSCPTGVRRRRRGARVDRHHEGGDRGRQARVARRGRRASSACPGVPHVGQARERGLRARGRRPTSDGEAVGQVDGLHGVLRARDGSRPSTCDAAPGRAFGDQLGGRGRATSDTGAPGVTRRGRRRPMPGPPARDAGRAGERAAPTRRPGQGLGRGRGAAEEAGILVAPVRAGQGQGRRRRRSRRASLRPRRARRGRRRPNPGRRAAGQALTGAVAA